MLRVGSAVTVLCLLLSATSSGQYRERDAVQRFNSHAKIFRGEVESPQTLLSSSSSSGSPFYKSVSQGLMRSFRWWDFAIAAVTVVPERLRPDEEEERIEFAPLSIDREVSDLYSHLGRRSSLGSSDPTIFPKVALASHLAGVIVLDLFTGMPIESHHYERVFVFYKALFYTKSVTTAAKHWFSRARPDGSDTHSFFSGHTSITFAASAFCYRGLSDLLDDVTITADPELFRSIVKRTAFLGLYGWASYVGYSRIRDNKHYLTDVLVGAAVGAAISNVLYSLHFGGDDRELKSRGGATLQISPVNGGLVGFVVRF